MPRTNTLEYAREYAREELDHDPRGAPPRQPGRGVAGERLQVRHGRQGRRDPGPQDRPPGPARPGGQQAAGPLADPQHGTPGVPDPQRTLGRVQELAHRLFEPSRERLELEDAALEPVMGRALESARMPGDGAIDRAERLERYQDRMSGLLYQSDIGPDFKAREIEQVLSDAQEYVSGREMDPENRTSYGYDSVRRMENEALRDMAAESDTRAEWTPVDNAVNALHHRGDTDAYVASRAAEEILMTNARLASEAVEQGDEWTYETVMDRVAWRAGKLARTIENRLGMAGGEGYNAPPAPEREHGVTGQMAYIIQVESRLDNPAMSLRRDRHPEKACRRAPPVPRVRGRTAAGYRIR